MSRARWRLLAFAAFALAAPGQAADLRSTEAVGAVPLHADARPASPPRAAAEQRALSEAVRRVALELLSDLDPAEVEPRLEAALGKDPSVYISRFRTIEDRGERPVLFSDDPEARTEYVVVVEASVDAGLVRQRLASAGLLTAPAGDVERFHVRLEVEGVTDYRAYEALRETLLAGVGVRSALPVELERGRAVLAVDGELSGEALFAALQRSAPPGLSLVALEAGPQNLRVRVAFVAEPTPSAAPPPAIDTSNPNRY